MKPLEGKVAIVTGAARGLGLDYAKRLAQMGAHIAISDLNLDSASEYEAEKSQLVDGSLEKTLAQYGTEVFMKQVDATDEEATKAFADDVYAKWGRIDVAVCNAGGGGDFSAAQPTQIVDESMKATFARNFYSTVYTAGAVAPYMKQQQSGKIITISSFTGVMALGEGHGADYAVAKGAVAHYTRCLAQELGPHGVNANAIAPGFIATGQFKERLGAADPERLKQWTQMSALRRLGRPEDCTNVVEFLASPLSDFVSGQVICVDGGILRGAS
ncbi:SDR family NAD(P)-dependent oxidoreductase [Arthrobacter sp. TE12232]